MRLSSRQFEAFALLMLAVSFGLLAWSAATKRGVAGWLLEGFGDQQWVLALVAALVVHTAAWAAIVVPIRYLSEKPTLGEEIRNLPQAMSEAFAEQDRRQRQFALAPNSLARRRHYRKLGVAGMGLGVTLCLATLGAYQGAGRLFLGLAVIGLTILVLGLWMVITGRPVGKPGVAK